ncbi:hypothetical protein [Pantoea piersonii]|uniref:hypothetical protein n=1 Tax=Pantoea piersonii TaxID=2364647 RepID=UPI0022F1BF55|nr:hypothetical protein [Pantoea piersonii]WBV20818.1 hypothetical protein PG877_14570 [Pantoea piersonii]
MAPNEKRRFSLPVALFILLYKPLTLFSSDSVRLAALLRSGSHGVSGEMKKYVSLLLTSAGVSCMFKKTPVSTGVGVASWPR